MSYNTRYSIFILNHPAMNKQILLAFGIVWTILVLIGYWGFHPYYSVALGDLPNLRLFLTLAILSGGAWWVYRTKKVELKGWMIYGFVLLLQSVTFLVYSSGADVFKESPVAHLPYFLGYQLFYMVRYCIWPWSRSPGVSWSCGPSGCHWQIDIARLPAWPWD